VQTGNGIKVEREAQKANCTNPITVGSTTTNREGQHHPQPVKKRKVSGGRKTQSGTLR